MSGAHRASTFARHLLSWKFMVTLAVLELAKLGVGMLAPVERGRLGGFDSIAWWADWLSRRDWPTRALALAPPESVSTVVVGITAEDVVLHLGGTRPVSPAHLVRAVERILAFGPTVLVVDVFTDDTAYARPGLVDTLFGRGAALVWARALDPGTNEVLEPLGGTRPLPGVDGLAALLLDPDLQARRFRLRYAAAGIDAAVFPHGRIPSLPLVAAVRCRELREPGCAHAPELESADTSSVALQIYPREPAMYVLSDVVDSTMTPDPTLFAGKIVVLGFVDGSDQAITPWGVRHGPFVVADAIQTLIDPRGAVRALPIWAGLSVDAALAILVAWLFYQFSAARASQMLLVLTIVAFMAAVVVFARLRFWTDPIIIIVGIWLEQMYESMTARQPGSGADRGAPAAAPLAPAAVPDPVPSESAPSAHAVLAATPSGNAGGASGTKGGEPGSDPAQ